MVKCVVCDKEAEEMSEGYFHCGGTRLLETMNEHYLSFEALPDILPEKGCPVCGRPMVNVGRFKWTFTDEEDGLERMFCDQEDHYVYVTKEWYKRRGC